MKTYSFKALTGAVITCLLLIAAGPALAGGFGSEAAGIDFGDGFMTSLGVTNPPGDLAQGKIVPMSAPVVADWQILSPALLDTGPAETAKPLILAAAAEPEPPTIFSASFAPFNLPGSQVPTGHVPLSTFEVLAMTPGGYGRLLAGQPGNLEYWSNACETAISYIRPNVSVQMILTFLMPGGEQGTTFEGSGFDANARLTVDHHTKVHSEEVGSGTQLFGLYQVPPPLNEPQTAVAAGVDLGILPTFLAQMGLNLAIVASRGEESGDLRIALVGTGEMPIDWAPRERPIQHLAGLPVNPLVNEESPYPFASASVGSGRLPSSGPRFPPETPPIPIIPENPPTPITPTPPPTPVPEPASLALVAAGAVASLILRRRRAA